MAFENPNMLLVKAISLCYINKTMLSPIEAAQKAIDQILPYTEMKQEILGVGSEGEINQALRTTLQWMLDAPADETFDAIVLGERITMDCSFADEYVKSALRLMDVDNLTKDQKVTRIQTIISELRRSIRTLEIGKKLAKANQEFNYGRVADPDDFVRELNEGLELVVAASQGNAHMNGFAGKVDFSDQQSIEDTIAKSEELISPEGVLKTGLIGLNRVFGVGGIVRGGEYLAGALTHNYKTGMSLKLTSWIPLYNKPFIINHEDGEDRKGLVLRISFENKPEQDINEIITNVYVSTTGKLPPNDLSRSEKATYCREQLEKNGFKVEMLCYDPNDMDVFDLVNIIASYEQQGYEIHMVIIDYLELLCKNKGKNAALNMRTDELITYSYEYVRNYCFRRGIANFHFHQLSTEAKDLTREGTSNFAKRISGGGYWRNAKSLDDKVDVDLTMHIHKTETDAFLTFANHKNRFSAHVPDKHKFFGYKFHGDVGIMDDYESGVCEAVYNWSSVTQVLEDNEDRESNGVVTEDDWG